MTHRSSIHLTAPRFLSKQPEPPLAPVAAAIDLAVLAGTGGSQPTGVNGTSGIGTAAGTTLALSHILTAHQAVGDANADDAALTWVSTPAVRKLLAGREKISTSGLMLWQGDMIDNRLAFATTACPSATLFLGDFSKVTLAVYGPGLVVDATDKATAANFQRGVTSARVMALVDAGVRRPTAFYTLTSIT